MTKQTILTNWDVFYDETAADTVGYKQLVWVGGVGTNTVNELYSELMHLFNDPGNQTPVSTANLTTPMRAVTPTEYQIGSFDVGDGEPWFIDEESIKHLTGGALSSANWTREDTVSAGIVKVPMTSGLFVTTDRGRLVTNATSGSTGRVLDYDNTAGYVWIRPTSEASAHDWLGSVGVMNVTGGTATAGTQSGPRTTGEMIWSNIFSIGTIEANTRVYVAQDNAAISNTEDTGSGAWWGDGHIDILVLTTDQDTLTDRGLLTIYARQYSKLFDNFVTNVATGGRTAIPLGTGDDLNNTTGYREIAHTTPTVAFVEGEIATGQTSTAVAIVTAYSATLLTYYLVGDLTDFNASENILGSIAGDIGTSGAAANASPGPADALAPTFGLDSSLDIDQDVVNENYSIVIDLSSTIRLTDLYERMKYQTRRGSAVSLDGIEGQQYIGIDNRIDYTTINGTPANMADGSTITQVLADGTTLTTEIVAHDITNKYLMLRDTRGVFETDGAAATLGIDGTDNITMSSGITIEAITPIKAAPFGTFAGGTFFCARGVALKNVHTDDKAFYQALDNGGTVRTEPVQTTFSITGARAGSEIRLFTDDGLRTELGTGIEDSVETVATFTVVNGGSGYVQGETVTVNGGTASTASTGTVNVTTGVVDSVTITDAGSYTLRPNNVDTNAMTGGSGTLLSVKIGWNQTPFSFSYDHAVDIPFEGSDVAAYAVVHHLNHPYIFLADLTLTVSDQSIPVQQQTERNYLNA